MLNNDIYNELSKNFLEYAVAVNSDRAIPNSTDGLKPVAKRIIYGAYDCGFKSDKPHVKCANIVGNVMATWHPHGDSSIYGALVRLSQPWVMRYPLIDFHGSNGNIDGDGPAAYRYTEARLAKLTEEGMLAGIKKNNVDFTLNYSETENEPIELPSIFPNLLCNPNSGIGVAIACNWAPHNLREVRDAIKDYINGLEPMLPGPDFPSGGVVINKNDIPNIMRTGHGSVKLRAKYSFEKNNIVFTELPFGVNTEALMDQIGAASDSGEITGINHIRNESNKKGFRLVIECDKNAQFQTILNKLFAKTNLQVSFSYNQVALVNKTPTELNLKDCIKIYISHNEKCIEKETLFDKEKAENRLHIIEGLLKALEDIDNIIKTIKASKNSSEAKTNLSQQYGFSDTQSDAIVNMKLGKLASLEKVEIENEKAEVVKTIDHLNWILANLNEELINRLDKIVDKYGDARRTELTQLDIPKEEKEIVYVEPEKCVVVMTEAGTIKRIPTTSFKTQKRNGKGVKTQEEITSMILRTNTIDSLMIFSDQGKMYRLLVDNIPVGTNVSKGSPIKALTAMEPNENPTTMYSIYRDTDAKYVFFATKNGLVKKTSLEEYIGTRKKTGVGAISFRDGDSLASVSLIKDEDILILTKNGYCIKFSSNDVSATGRLTYGVKGVALNDGDYVIAAMPIRHAEDSLAIFTENGNGKKVALKEFTIQKRGGKGVIAYKGESKVAAAALVEDSDNVLIVGDKSSICIAASELPLQGRSTSGNSVLKTGGIQTVSKV